MPQLIFKGIKENDLLKMSTELVSELSRLSETPRDYFTLECVNNPFVFDGKSFNMYPLVEVKWFDRGMTCKHEMATCITNFLKSYHYDGIEVYFTPIAKNDYFENGEVCG